MKVLGAGYYPRAGNPARTYNVPPDGEGFLVIERPGLAPPTCVVVEHWGQELEARAPVQ